jgi:hypothetical protein
MAFHDLKTAVMVYTIRKSSLIKLILGLFGFNGQCSMWYGTKSFLGNELAGFSADAINLILNPDFSVLQMLNQFLLA